MRVWSLFVLCSLLASADLDQQFIDAAADSVAVVPLIAAVSAALPTLPADEAVALGDRIAPFCRRLFSDKLPGRERCGILTHVIAAGETPSVLARRYHTSIELIQRLNPGLDPKALSICQDVDVMDLAAVPL